EADAAVDALVAVGKRLVGGHQLDLPRLVPAIGGADRALIGRDAVQQGAQRLWLLLLPSFTYASTLGSTTAPVSLALNSGWSTPLVWAGGAATMAMCMVAIHVIAQMSHKRGALPL
ncbi:MAG: hypothetical protein K2X31_02325, partial [Sphingopyxis sp.]|nr:hypothetical protein [Sphingopyxis sp.]